MNEKAVETLLEDVKSCLKEKRFDENSKQLVGFELKDPNANIGYGAVFFRPLINGVPEDRQEIANYTIAAAFGKCQYGLLSDLLTFAESDKSDLVNEIANAFNTYFKGRSLGDVGGIEHTNKQLSCHDDTLYYLIPSKTDENSGNKLLLANKIIDSSVISSENKKTLLESKGRFLMKNEENTVEVAEKYDEKLGEKLGNKLKELTSLTVETPDRDPVTDKSSSQRPSTIIVSLFSCIKQCFYSKKQGNEIVQRL